jgi:hypothetical protein
MSLYEINRNKKLYEIIFPKFGKSRFGRDQLEKLILNLVQALTSVSDPDPHGSAFNWSPGSGSRRVKKS